VVAQMAGLPRASSDHWACPTSLLIVTEEIETMALPFALHLVAMADATA
jgi:hypothetical protein